MRVEKAVIIDEPWISEILAGRKIWELRSRAWKHRGPVGLLSARAAASLSASPR